MNPLNYLKASSLLLIVALMGCGKETEELGAPTVAEYQPTVAGKYITYRLDSTVTINFGQSLQVNSYQEKHQVDAQLTDNLGRPAYRVFRYLRDAAGTTAWQPAGTYFITPQANTVEVVENNLRFLKLAGPVTEDYTWRGNRFLPNDPYVGYEFSNDDGMVDWDFSYSDVGRPAVINGKNFANTVTVTQVKDSSNFPVTAPFFGYLNYAVDVYAKGVGLVRQDLRMFEYQPPSSPRPGFKGFGLRRTVIDYN